MAAIVTDQFRIANASNFLGDVNNTQNSYYVVVGLSNPGIGNSAYGRANDNNTWNASPLNPVDNFNYEHHVGDTMIFGRKITSDNIRRVVRKLTWTQGTKYEMYRHDYSSATGKQAPLTGATRLYDANYFVINKDFRVYICIENGSTGIANTQGKPSNNEPLFTSLEPTRASGSTDDGYVWKYLFSVNPSDIIKFDSTEYIPLPNNWESSTETQIQNVRENGDSSLNNNQIKTVYIDNPGNGYNGNGGEFNIVGDGEGAKVVIDINQTKVSNITVSAGGKGYSYGMVDLSGISTGAVQANTPAKLIPIIPPAKGHGSDLYKELGADKVLIYSRFDDSTKDFPIDTKFAQIGIVKNPTSIGSTQVFTENQFSSVSSLLLNSTSGTISVGDIIFQDIKQDGSKIGEAKGYVVSYDEISADPKVAVLKYYQDRSLYFNQSTGDQTDQSGITSMANPSTGKIYQFQPLSANQIQKSGGGFSAGINTSFSGVTTNPTGNKIIDLGVEFNDGIASAEINKGSGDVIYLDNRKLVTRDPRQKEDVKIILEF